MKNIVIIGAGDLGKEVVWLIEDINKVKPTYVILGFLDDDQEKHGGEFYGYKVLGGVGQLEYINSQNPVFAVIAIRDGIIRKKIALRYSHFDAWESIIHPTSVVASTSHVGRGSIIFPHVTISVDTKLGQFGLYYIHSTICNDCVIGDYVSIMSGALIAERAEIGEGCYLSAGSVVYPHKHLMDGEAMGNDDISCRDYKDRSKVGGKRIGLSLLK